MICVRYNLLLTLVLMKKIINIQIKLKIG